MKPFMYQCNKFVACVLFGCDVNDRPTFSWRVACTVYWAADVNVVANSVERVCANWFHSFLKSLWRAGLPASLAPLTALILSCFLGVE